LIVTPRPSSLSALAKINYAFSLDVCIHVTRRPKLTESMA